MNVDFIGRLFQVTAQSNDLDSFCRNAIHNLWPTFTFNSAQFFTLSPDGFLDRAAGYFLDGPQDEDRKIPFSANHPATIAAKTGEACLDLKKHKSVAMPIRTGGWLQGVFVLEPLSVSSINVDPEEMLVLGSAVGSFISGLATLRKSKSDFANSKPDQLTTRQLQILRGMDEGLIYAQIASNLHVSESLVKLEVTRIFRFFGVSGRSAALRAGRELLSASTPPPPPPPRELVAG